MQSQKTSFAKGNAIRMQWTNWANQAFEHQLTLLNWFPGKRCPGESGFKLKSVEGKEVDKAVAAQKKVAEFPNDVEAGTVISIVSWSDGMNIWLVI